MNEKRVALLHELAPELEQRALELVKGRKLDSADPQVQLANYYAKLAEWCRTRKVKS
jgi:hypothetical protein